MIKTLQKLTPPFKRGERGVLLVTLADRRKKPPLWFPGGWLIATHDGRGTSLGWTIGPKNEAAFATHDYAAADLIKLKAHPADARRQAMDLFDNFRDDRTKRPTWIGVLYLPARRVSCLVP